MTIDVASSDGKGQAQFGDQPPQRVLLKQRHGLVSNAAETPADEFDADRVCVDRKSRWVRLLALVSVDSLELLDRLPGAIQTEPS